MDTVIEVHRNRCGCIDRGSCLGWIAANGSPSSPWPWKGLAAP